MLARQKQQLPTTGLSTLPGTQQALNQIPFPLPIPSPGHPQIPSSVKELSMLSTSHTPSFLVLAKENHNLVPMCFSYPCVWCSPIWPPFSSIDLHHIYSLFSWFVTKQNISSYLTDLVSLMLVPAALEASHPFSFLPRVVFNAIHGQGAEVGRYLFQLNLCGGHDMQEDAKLQFCQHAIATVEKQVYNSNEKETQNGKRLLIKPIIPATMWRNQCQDISVWENSKLLPEFEQSALMTIRTFLSL